MSRKCAGDSEVTLSFPRVSGDEPVTTSESITLSAFSPRERG